MQTPPAATAAAAAAAFLVAGAALYVVRRRQRGAPSRASRQAKRQERLKRRGISKFELGRKWKAVRWDRVLGRECEAPYYFMRSGLIRKDLLPIYATRENIPTSHRVDSYEELCETMEDEPDVHTWVLKFPDSSNAFGMKFFQQAEDVQDDFEDSEPRVIQRYLPSLLLQDRKFHLRALVLVVGDLEVLLYDELRVLIASEPLDMQDLDNEFMHITNRSHNQKHPDYCEKTQNLRLMLPAPGMPGGGEADPTLAALDPARIATQMADMLAFTFKRLRSNRRHFFALPNCYELFGLDFMLDEDSRLWLLEANPDPSMGMYMFDRSEVMSRECRERIIGPDPLRAEQRPAHFYSVYKARADKGGAKGAEGREAAAETTGSKPKPDDGEEQPPERNTTATATADMSREERLRAGALLLRGAMMRSMQKET